MKRLVGERGFEPPTPWSRTRCSTRLSHSPTLLHCAPALGRARRATHGCEFYENAPTSTITESLAAHRSYWLIRVGHFAAKTVNSFCNLRHRECDSIVAHARARGPDLATVLLARKLFTPLEAIDDAVLMVEDGIISSVGDRSRVRIPPDARVLDFGDAVLAPGLIDIHIHGGAGHDVMEGSDESLAAIERLMIKHGVTSYCPTTVTAPVDATLRSLEALGKAVERAACGNGDGTRARPLGVHLEGPFLSHAKRGVHPPALLQPASCELFERMWQAAGGRVSVMTIAPEIEGAMDLIAEASRRGVCVSLGHSDAELPQARAAIKAGARHATHTFNAMRALDHRRPGLLGAVLTDRTVTADIIVDGIHVDPVMVDLFLRAKGIEGAVLITDAISATGMPDGTYMLGGFPGAGARWPLRVRWQTRR